MSKEKNKHSNSTMESESTIVDNNDMMSVISETTVGSICSPVIISGLKRFGVQDENFPVELPTSPTIPNQDKCHALVVDPSSLQDCCEEYDSKDETAESILVKTEESYIIPGPSLVNSFTSSPETLDPSKGSINQVKTSPVIECKLTCPISMPESDNVVCLSGGICCRKLKQNICEHEPETSNSNSQTQITPCNSPAMGKAKEIEENPTTSNCISPVSVVLTVPYPVTVLTNVSLHVSPDVRNGSVCKEIDVIETAQRLTSVSPQYIETNVKNVENTQLTDGIEHSLNNDNDVALITNKKGGKEMYSVNPMFSAKSIQFSPSTGFDSDVAGERVPDSLASCLPVPCEYILERNAKIPGREQETDHSYPNTKEQSEPSENAIANKEELQNTPVSNGDSEDQNKLHDSPLPREADKTSHNYQNTKQQSGHSDEIQHSVNVDNGVALITNKKIGKEIYSVNPRVTAKSTQLSPFTGFDSEIYSQTTDVVGERASCSLASIFHIPCEYISEKNAKVLGREQETDHSYPNTKEQSEPSENAITNNEDLQNTPVSNANFVNIGEDQNKLHDSFLPTEADKTSHNYQNCVNIDNEVALVTHKKGEKEIYSTNPRVIAKSTQLSPFTGFDSEIYSHTTDAAGERASNSLTSIFHIPCEYISEKNAKIPGREKGTDLSYPNTKENATTNNEELQFTPVSNGDANFIDIGKDQNKLHDTPLPIEADKTSHCYPNAKEQSEVSESASSNNEELQNTPFENANANICEYQNKLPCYPLPIEANKTSIPETEDHFLKESQTLGIDRAGECENQNIRYIGICPDVTITEENDRNSNESIIQITRMGMSSQETAPPSQIDQISNSVMSSDSACATLTSPVNEPQPFNSQTTKKLSKMYRLEQSDVLLNSNSLNIESVDNETYDCNTSVVECNHNCLQDINEGHSVRKNVANSAECPIRNLHENANLLLPSPGTSVASRSILDRNNVPTKNVTKLGISVQTSRNMEEFARLESDVFPTKSNQSSIDASRPKLEILEENSLQQTSNTISKFNKTPVDENPVGAIRMTNQNLIPTSEPTKHEGAMNSDVSLLGQNNQRKSQRESKPPIRFTSPEFAKINYNTSANVVAKNTFSSKRNYGLNFECMLHQKELSICDQLETDYYKLESSFCSKPIDKTFLKHCSCKIKELQPRLMKLLYESKEKSLSLTRVTKDRNLTNDAKSNLKMELSLLSKRQKKLKDVYGRHCKIQNNMKLAVSKMNSQLVSGKVYAEKYRPNPSKQIETPLLPFSQSTSSSKSSKLKTQQTKNKTQSYNKPELSKITSEKQKPPEYVYDLTNDDDSLSKLEQVVLIRKLGHLEKESNNDNSCSATKDDDKHGMNRNATTTSTSRRLNSSKLKTANYLTACITETCTQTAPPLNVISTKKYNTVTIGKNDDVRTTVGSTLEAVCNSIEYQFLPVAKVMNKTTEKDAFVMVKDTNEEKRNPKSTPRFVPPQQNIVVSTLSNSGNMNTVETVPVIAKPYQISSETRQTKLNTLETTKEHCFTAGTSNKEFLEIQSSSKPAVSFTTPPLTMPSKVTQDEEILDIILKCLHKDEKPNSQTIESISTPLDVKHKPHGKDSDSFSTEFDNFTISDDDNIPSKNKNQIEVNLLKRKSSSVMSPKKELQNKKVRIDKNPNLFLNPQSTQELVQRVLKTGDINFALSQQSQKFLNQRWSPTSQNEADDRSCFDQLCSPESKHSRFEIFSKPFAGTVNKNNVFSRKPGFAPSYNIDNAKLVKKRNKAAKAPMKSPRQKKTRHSPSHSVMSFTSANSTSSKRFLQKMKDKAVKISQAKVKREYQISMRDGVRTALIFQKKFPSLKKMMLKGLMNPGKNNLVVYERGEKCVASLLESGDIKSSNGEIFKTPTRWLTAITGSQQIKNAKAFRTIRYGNRPLIELKKQFEKLDYEREQEAIRDNYTRQHEAHKFVTPINFNQCTEGMVPNTATNSDRRFASTIMAQKRYEEFPNIPVSDKLTPWHPGKLLKSNCLFADPKCTAVSTGSSEFKNCSMVQSHPSVDINKLNEDEWCQKEIKNILCNCVNVLLVSDLEVTKYPDVSEEFWTKSFKDVDLSKEFWVDVDTWKKI